MRLGSLWGARISQLLATSVREARECFALTTIATLVLDLLLHHSHVLNIRGDSYRLCHNALKLWRASLPTA